MKHVTFTIITLFTILFYANAQKKSVCLVKYKELKSKVILGTFNHWFYQDQLIASRIPNYRAICMRGFPVLLNNVMTTQTDTTKYNKEFNEFVSDNEQVYKSKPETVNMKYYKSDILKTSLSATNLKGNYIIIDSLDKMNSWEILEDTLTFLGYKCQKATINYQGIKYSAWFTTQLPYNAGPDVFSGLPGLILKVSNPSENLGFEAIEIQTPYRGIISKFNDVGETISKKEWLIIAGESRKKSMEAMNNMINEYKKQGAIIRQ